MKPQFVVFMGLILLFGCSSIKEYVPVVTGPSATPVPNQQRIVSNSADQAVKKAVEKLGLTRYKGRTARVEVVGVYPGGDTSLFEYIRATIEGLAMSAGMRVLPPLDKEKLDRGTIVMPIVNTTLSSPSPIGTSRSGTLATPSASTTPERTTVPTTNVVPSPQEAAENSWAYLGTPQKEDVRILAKVDWGGVDLKDHSYTKAWPLVGQVGLGVLGIVGAAMLATSDSDLAVPGVALLLSGIVGDGLWILFQHDDYVAHTFTATGRTKVTIYAIPQAESIEGTQGDGDGESQIVIDSEDKDGYTIKRLSPKENEAF
jgi:hypothetical protein